MSTYEPAQAPPVLPGGYVLPGNEAPDPFAIQVPSRPERTYSWRKEVLVGLVVVAVMALIGVLGALIWAWAAPKVNYQINDSGQVAVLSTEPEQAIAGDAWFAIIGVVIGLVVGFRVWWHTKGHEPGAAGGLLVGGLVGSFVMLGLGTFIRSGNLEVAASGGSGTKLHAALTVHATGVLLLESVVAVFVWVVLDLLVPRDDPAVLAPEPTFTPPPKHASEVASAGDGRDQG
jgi:hypothetical protein